MITLKPSEREVVNDIEHCLKDMFEVKDVEILSLRERSKLTAQENMDYETFASRSMITVKIHYDGLPGKRFIAKMRSFDRILKYIRDEYGFYMEMDKDCFELKIDPVERVVRVWLTFKND